MANNWNFNSGTVLNMLNSQLERNAAEERMTQQLAAEAENYRLLREHQMAMQENQQGWQSGENVLGRQHDIFMQDDQQAFQKWAQNDMQAFEGGENQKNRQLQLYIARQNSRVPVINPATGDVEYRPTWDNNFTFDVPGPIPGLGRYRMAGIMPGMENFPLFASSAAMDSGEKAPHVRLPFWNQLGQGMVKSSAGVPWMAGLGAAIDIWSDPVPTYEKNRFIDRYNTYGPMDRWRSRMRSQSLPMAPRQAGGMGPNTAAWIYGNGLGLLAPE